MVAVTKLNFHQLLPVVLSKLSRASFVAVDLEMTGIQSFGGERNRQSDDFEDRYPRMVGVATRYAMIQVGLTFFEPHDDGSSRLVASPYAFYVFPEYGSDVVMSASSITFLKQHGMDFNTWITNGIPFSDTRAAANIKEVRDMRLAAAAAASNENGAAAVAPPAGPELVPNKPEDVLKLAAQKSALAAFVADPAQTEYLVPPQFPFVRKCIYQHLETVYPALRTKKGPENYSILVMKVDASQQAALDQEEAAKMDEKLGFRLVWEALCDSKKPIVGHNCLFDLLFLYRWLDRPLPYGLADFRARFNEVMGEVYDTKILAGSDILGAPADPEQQTDLGSLYKVAVLENPSFDPAAQLCFAEGMAYDEADKQAHDAGYDSYMTGAIFARYLQGPGGMDAIRAGLKNRLYLNGSMYHANLQAGELHSISKTLGDVYHLSSFPDDTTTDHVVAAGFPADVFEINWEGASSLFLVAKAGTALPAAPLPEGWRLRTLREHEEARELSRRPIPDANDLLDLMEQEQQQQQQAEGPDAKKAKTSCEVL